MVGKYRPYSVKKMLITKNCSLSYFKYAIMFLQLAHFTSVLKSWMDFTWTLVFTLKKEHFPTDSTIFAIYLKAEEAMHECVYLRSMTFR